MDELTVEPREWKPLERRMVVPSVEGTAESVIVRDPEGNVILLSVPLVGGEDSLSHLARTLRLGVRWDNGGTTGMRMSGIEYPARVFGYTEPQPMRKRYGAAPTRLDREDPALARVLARIAGRAWAELEAHAPDVAASHRQIASAVHEDWWMGGVPFTSGIINNSAQLPYHRDAGNLKGTWSAMLALREGVEGGHLDMPELGITLSIPNDSMTLFNGQRFWHGVTPLVPVTRRAYRFTLVWYTKSRFRVCGSRADEDRRAQEYATRLGRQ